MPDYRLRLLIDPDALPAIRAAGQRITLARTVNSIRLPSVIWLSLDPFESTEVQWTGQYGIYASTTDIQHGAPITKLSETGMPAQDGMSYALTSAATFNGPLSGFHIARGCYAARNDIPFTSHRALTFGLTQSALVNQTPAERKPVSAMRVLSGRMADMMPFGKIYVWLQTTFSSGTIITDLPETTSVADFGGKITGLTLKYNTYRGMFLLQGGLTGAQD